MNCTAEMPNLTDKLVSSSLRYPDLKHVWAQVKPSLVFLDILDRSEDQEVLEVVTPQNTDMEPPLPEGTRIYVYRDDQFDSSKGRSGTLYSFKVVTPDARVDYGECSFTDANHGTKVISALEEGESVSAYFQENLYRFHMTPLEIFEVLKKARSL